MVLCRLHDTAEWLQSKYAPGATIVVEQLYRQVGHVTCNTVEIAVTSGQALIQKPRYVKNVVWSRWMKEALPRWRYDPRETVWRYVRISAGAADLAGLAPGFVHYYGRMQQEVDF